MSQKLVQWEVCWYIQSKRVLLLPYLALALVHRLMAPLGFFFFLFIDLDTHDHVIYLVWIQLFSYFLCPRREKTFGLSWN